MDDIRIAVIAGTRETGSMLCRQLDELLGAYMTFYPYPVTEWNEGEKMDLVLFSSHILFTRHPPSHGGARLTDALIIKRTLTRAGWELIRKLPPGNRYLVVNDERDSVVETISLLYEAGLRQVDLLPYYPGLPDIYDAAAAITPGEAHLIPESVKETIDIGPRVVDVSTLVEILTRFNLLNHETRKLLDKYGERIVSLSQGLQQTMHRLIDAKNLFEETLNMVQDGVVTYDEEGSITFVNRTAEEIFGEPAASWAGRTIGELFGGHGLDRSLLDSAEELKDRLLTVGKQAVIVNNMRILGRGGHSESVLIFKIAQKVEELELKLRTQLRDKGHAARFSFRDIVTSSEQMLRIIARARKMAGSELSVLILGENGTGKELFAHSIHNQSPRASFPFIAVNCSALSESLLESELFGYEDGAFTGARRGGKPGLFEQAHRGTIFLDEIGDISPALQTRLLRVLQQKEIMKVGGTRVLPVDVRIIAATNRDLYQMVKEGRFREDLYYRLKVLHIEIPPLRDRKADIAPLVRFFLERRGVSREPSPEFMAALARYEWPGNVRELENTIEYMMIMSEGEFSEEELPFAIERSAEEPAPAGSASRPEAGPGSAVPAAYLEDSRLERAILELILKAQLEGRPAGRRNLTRLAESAGLLIAESQMRHWIGVLSGRGLVEVRIGRGGCRLTRKGYEMLTEDTGGGSQRCL